jgi:hypothetical protein
MADPRIRRESYRDFDIMISVDEFPSLHGGRPRCVASLLIHREGKTLHTANLATTFITCEAAEDSALVAAQQWIDTQGSQHASAST